MRLIIVSVLFGLTAQFVMKENVIFQKVKEITTVRARWMVTFVEESDAKHNKSNQINLRFHCNI